MSPHRAFGDLGTSAWNDDDAVMRTTRTSGPSRHVPCPSVETVLMDDGTLLLLPVRGGEQVEVAAPFGRYVHDVVVAGRAVADCVPEADVALFESAIRSLAAKRLLVREACVAATDVGRYDRQVRWFAQEGTNGPRAQRRLAAATVLVIGVGGFGSAMAELLARAGIGQLVLTDPDRVEAGNLPRQLLYDEQVVGARKSHAAAARIEQIAPGVEVVATEDEIAGAGDVTRLVRRHRPSLVVCAADRPPIAIKGWVDEGAFAQGVPVLHGGSRAPLVYVGPLLVPGTTPCYECFLASRVAPGADELEAEVNLRRDAEPPIFPGVGWCDVASAAFATGQAVALLTGVHRPAILGRELEFDARSLAQDWMDPLPHHGTLRCDRCSS